MSMVQRAYEVYVDYPDEDGEETAREAWYRAYHEVRYERRLDERAAERGEEDRENQAMDDINGGGDDEMSQFST